MGCGPIIKKTRYQRVCNITYQAQQAPLVSSVPPEKCVVVLIRHAGTIPSMILTVKRKNRNLNYASDITIG